MAKDKTNLNVTPQPAMKGAGKEKSSHRIQIIVAFIGLAGVLGAALVSNWDKIPWDRVHLPGGEIMADFPCHNRNPVKIISIPGKGYKLAQQVKARLKTNGCSVEGPYPRSDVTENPATHQVRFFYRANEDEAGNVALYLRTELGIGIVPQYVTGVEPPSNARGIHETEDLQTTERKSNTVPNWNSEPRGQLEIWLR